MSSHISLIEHRLRTPSAFAESNSGLPDDESIFQKRLRLYFVVLLSIAGGLHLVALVADMVLRERGVSAALTSVDSLMRSALVVGFGSGFVALRKTTLPRPTLLALDLLAALLVAAVTVMMTWLRPGELRPELSAVFSGTIVLVTRAALVPSTPLRTILTGSVVLLPAVVAGPYAYSATQSFEGMPFRSIAAVTAACWAIAALAATAVTSHVIYGLQRSVGRALKLGQYELGKKLGEGGMGEVYEARHATLGRQSAIKLIRPSQLDAASATRFRREVELTAELRHPNTITLYDYGQTADGIFFYAMELVDGVTLADLVTHDGSLPPGRTAYLLRQVVSSLADAHDRGLVHRDIKATNVMVQVCPGYADLVKVLDFGLAKRVDASDPQCSGRVALVGTPAYMAPESLDGTGGPSADIYAVGVLAYFLLTGSHPFVEKSIAATISAHLHDTPVPPSLRCPYQLPSELEEVILRCLAKDPAKRYANAAALLPALDECLRAVPWSQERSEEWWIREGEAVRESEGANASSASFASWRSKRRGKRVIGRDADAEPTLVECSN